MNNNLKNIRTAKGLSLDDLADQVNSSKSYIWELEKGKSHPSLIKAYAICHVLGHRIEDVFPDPNEYETVTITIIKKKSITPNNSGEKE